MASTWTRRGIGVRYVMLVVVAVPLVSFLVLAIGAVRSADREVSAAQRAKAAGEQLTASTDLEAAVAVEHYWAGATVVVRQFGLEPADLRGVLGVDVMEEWTKSQAVVDQLRPSADVGDLVSRARATLDVDGGGAYVQAEQLAGAAVDRVKMDLADAALAVDQPAQMVSAAAALSGSIDLRSEVFDMVANLFGARFPEKAHTAHPTEELIASRARYREVAATLARQSVDSAALADALGVIEQDPVTQAFLADTDQAIAEVGLPPAVRDPTAELMLQATTFSNSLTVLDRFAGAVEITSADLAATGERMTSSAEDTRLVVVLALAGVGCVTIAIAVVIGRWMVRSLDGISASATAMNDGDLDQPAPVRGPTEVRVAAVALNGASANIRSAERQVLAMASGDLSDSPDVDDLPGRLGYSLNAAFDRLTESMKDTEQLRRDLHQEANHDGLTGLPNRSAIMRGLAAAVEAAGPEEQVAVLFVDIDDFKSINDHHGHAVGDEVLKGIADRVRVAARSGDIVGRLGGDELVVIAHPVNGLPDALGLARRIRKAVSRPLPIAADITPSLSIGVATGSGPGTSPERLLHDADLAVYEAKAAGGNVIEICTNGLREASDHRQSIERTLARAIVDGGLDVAVQAVVGADDGVLMGVEALVRWPQEDGTVRAPIEFVAVAERSNLVVELDRWVIGETVRVLAGWKDDPRTASLTASVNLSARHASVMSFSDDILGTLERHGVEPGRLVVELTESALIANLDHVVEELRRLREHGVSVAVDDFGTGYTSLALLHQLPIDTLKLDRVLTANLGVERVRAVVQLVVDTAHLIGLSVTAEGVETAEQVDELRALGVDALQGFLLHRPSTVAAFVEGMVGQGDVGDAGGEVAVPVKR
jgi:diguanylate cyclase (GGDEF)-like protein